MEKVEKAEEVEDASGFAFPSTGCNRKGVDVELTFGGIDSLLLFLSLFTIQCEIEILISNWKANSNSVQLGRSEQFNEL